ncbi:hypothetical protein D3C81_1758560 [compost metagenome]
MDNHSQKIIDGAVSGLHDATDHLLAKSREIAPLDTGTLRMTAGKEVVNRNGQIYGEVFYSATNQSRSGVRFNYALRVHEMPLYRNPTTPRTRPRFLTSSLQIGERLYKQYIADGIRRALS